MWKNGVRNFLTTQQQEQEQNEKEAFSIHPGVTA